MASFGMFAPLGLFSCLLIYGAPRALSISTISATNETVATGRCVEERACSCVQPAIMKCFCPNDTYPMHFRFGQLVEPFDLLQIGACRQLTLYGQPYSDHPPEFVQIFDTDDIFHDRTLATPLPVSPYPPLATATRPIRRIEFLNVTIAYLALSDFYSLNRIEQFIVQNSTVKVLGGRPPDSGHSSNMGSIQLLSSLFIEIRRDALDVQGLNDFLLTNSTVHQWRSGATRLLTNQGARIVITDCSVVRMEAAALSLLASDHEAALMVDRNRFGHLADDAFRLVDAKHVDVHFHGNRVREARPRALVALPRGNFSANVFPCGQPLCLTDDFLRQGEFNECWKRLNGTNDDMVEPFTVEAMALPTTDEACHSPMVDDYGARPSTVDGVGAGALCCLQPVILTALLAVLWLFR